MPRIFDNIELPLLPALRDTIKLSYRADFCVGYFNLRGWRSIGDLIEAYMGNQGACCRLLVGMQSLPADELNASFSLISHHRGIDNNAIIRLKIGNYIAKKPKQKPNEAEQRQLNALFRGGRRLMGFSRTNLFKRLESSGSAFIQSIERYILRNFIYLYAIDQNFDIPAPRMQTC